MTVLALRLSHRANAVSSLHGQVSRAMWTPLYRDAAKSECPSATSPTACTCDSWLAPQMRQVYDRHLGPDWPKRAGDPALWEAIDAIDDGEMWETHQTLKVAAHRLRAPTDRSTGRAAERGRQRSSPSCAAR